MESNSHEEESLNSSEEVEQDNVFDHLGIGRSYECVYCKRGFDSAQALGGHMNIHRKDKSRNKPTSRKAEDNNYTGPRSYQQIPESRNDHFEHRGYHIKYATHFQEYSSTSGATRVPLYESHNNEQQQQIYRHTHDLDRDTNSLVSGDWRVGLEFTPLIMEDLEKNKQAEINPKDDLDLELRLGYDS